MNIKYRLYCNDKLDTIVIVNATVKKTSDKVVVRGRCIDNRIKIVSGPIH